MTLPLVGAFALGIFFGYMVYYLADLKLDRILTLVFTILCAGAGFAMLFLFGVTGTDATLTTVIIAYVLGLIVSHFVGFPWQALLKRDRGTEAVD
jgi:hypothetical protein